MKNNRLVLRTFIFSIGVLLLGLSISKAQNKTQKELIPIDWSYEDQIKTVLLYPKNEEINRTLQAPVTSLNNPYPLVLEFDEIGDTRIDYYAKILHYNADWTKSTLNEIEYLPDFNVFQIQDYQFSFNTKVAYTHYRLELPLVKISGNYLLVVYRENDPADIILSKRFVVYQNLVSVKPVVRGSNSVEMIEKNQQIDFNIEHGGYTILNPREQLKVVIRQNYRWDNAIYNLKPLYIRELDKKIDYSYTNLENNFKGLNVFRRFDMQSIRFLGFNMALIDLTGTEAKVRLQSDKSRGTEPYSLWADYHGGFIINHFESQNGQTESDYVKVYFTLKVDEPSNGDVFIRGAFNQYGFSDAYKMSYYAEEKAYQKSILLKQGSYNYIYSLRPKGESYLDDTYFEGSHYQTANLYDIIVYYRPLNARADIIIGYASFPSN